MSLWVKSLTSFIRANYFHGQISDKLTCNKFELLNIAVLHYNYCHCHTWASNLLPKFSCFIRVYIRSHEEEVNKKYALEWSFTLGWPPTDTHDRTIFTHSQHFHFGNCCIPNSLPRGNKCRGICILVSKWFPKRTFVFMCYVNKYTSALFTRSTKRYPGRIYSSGAKTKMFIDCFFFTGNRYLTM